MFKQACCSTQKSELHFNVLLIQTKEIGTLLEGVHKTKPAISSMLKDSNTSQSLLSDTSHVIKMVCGS